MKNSILFIFLLYLNCFAHAENEIRRYVWHVVENNLNMNEVDLEFSGWRQSISGGYILKFDFDGNGDGFPEHFITSSLEVEKLFFEWDVYHGKDGMRVGEKIPLRSTGFWWNRSTREFLDYIRYDAEGGMAILTQSKGGNWIIRNEKASLDEVVNGLEGRESPRQGFQWIKPEVSIALLADIVASEGPAWRSLSLDPEGSNYSLPNGKLLMAEDVNRVDKLRDFTPKVAMANLRELNAIKAAEIRKKSNDGNYLHESKSNMDQYRDSKPISKSDSFSRFYGWIAVIGIILTLFGFRWVIRRKNKI